MFDCAQDVIIVLPISVEPVKPSFRTNGWSAIACPVTEPVPGKMLITPLFSEKNHKLELERFVDLENKLLPFGKPANTDNSANFNAVNGQT